MLSLYNCSNYWNYVHETTKYIIQVSRLHSSSLVSLSLNSPIEVYFRQYTVMFRLAVCLLFMACSKTGSQASDSPTMAFIDAALRFKYPAGPVSAFVCWEASK